MDFDTIIRGGTIVDGSGQAARFSGDVAIHDGRIVEIGRVAGTARHTIDADGLIVAPGFIDSHGTHMDAQVAWDPLGSCSCWHGVTSVVMSNCGFAPWRPAGRRPRLVCALPVGGRGHPDRGHGGRHRLDRETFPNTSPPSSACPRAINYGMYIGHLALRMYVMGERAEREGDRGRHDAHGGGRSTGGAEGRSDGLLELARLHARHADDTPVASRIAEWERSTASWRPWPSSMPASSRSAPDIASGPRHRVFLERLRKVALDFKRPIMFGVLATKQGDGPDPWATRPSTSTTRFAAGGRMRHQARRARSTPSFAEILPAVRRPAGVAADPQRCRSRSRRSGCRTRQCARAGRRRGGDEAARQDLPGRRRGDDRSTQAGLRQPLFALKGVDWDDPTVDQLAKSGQHPSR